jgi:hypothetical protein
VGERDGGTRPSAEDEGHPSALGEQLLAVPVVAGLSFLATLDDIGGHLQSHHRTSVARPRNRIPPIVVLLIAVGILLTVLCIYAAIGTSGGGEFYVPGPGG